MKAVSTKAPALAAGSFHCPNRWNACAMLALAQTETAETTVQRAAPIDCRSTYRFLVVILGARIRRGYISFRLKYIVRGQTKLAQITTHRRRSITT